jgi:hypothetical protein
MDVIFQVKKDSKPYNGEYPLRTSLVEVTEEEPPARPAPKRAAKRAAPEPEEVEEDDEDEEPAPAPRRRTRLAPEPEEDEEDEEEAPPKRKAVSRRSAPTRPARRTLK